MKYDFIVRWELVLIGFVLAVIIKYLELAWSIELLGILIIGFIVGLLAKQGPWEGMYNAAVAGSLRIIVVAILFTIVGLFGEMVRFAIFGFVELIAIMVNLIYYVIIMGISEAIGRMIAGDRYY